jgi:hypothetical protein
VFLKDVAESAGRTPDLASASSITVPTGRPATRLC